MEKHLICIILVILLFILIINKKFESFINNNDNWSQYRLADIFLYWNNLKYQNYNFEYINNVKHKYKNSIGDLYLKKNQSRKPNYELMKKIVNEKSKNFKNLPKNNEVILHLRIGDSIKDLKNGKFIYHKNYATRIEYIDKIIPLIKNKKIILIYGSHNSKSKNKINLNEIYIKKIKEKLKKNKISFYEKFTGNPDDDFIYMCNSKTFIKSGGGFSKLIAKLVKKKGGKVIDPFI